MYDIFKLLLDNIHYPMWIKDTDLKYIFVNKSYVNLHNKKKKILLD